VSLHPTPTRRTLLAQIGAGLVMNALAAEHDEIILYPNAPTSYEWQRVTFRVRELEKAGWVQEDEEQIMWELTDAGRALLAEWMLTS
jgi:hypothetical protein